MKIEIITIAYHRNGICGAPFYVVLFRGEEGRIVGILFDRECHCAVFDVDRLHQGNIAFGSNSWRGDHFEPALRNAIAKFERGES